MPEPNREKLEANNRLTSGQVRAGRALARMTVRRLAGAAGMSTKAVCAYEQGQGSPRFETSERFRRVLDSAGVDFHAGGWARLRVEAADVMDPSEQREPGRQSIGAVHAEQELAENLMLGYIHYPENQRQRCIIQCLPIDADELTRRRFAREAILGMEVTRDNENLLTTLHFGHWQDGRLFMAVDCVEGRAVSEILEGLRRDIATIRGIADSALGALRYLHKRGVAYGVISAENLLIGHDGIVRLGNFSSAKRITEPDDVANDLRALGALLFLLVTGVQLGSVSTERVEDHIPESTPSEFLMTIAHLLAGTDGDVEVQSTHA